MRSAPCLGCHHMIHSTLTSFFSFFYSGHAPLRLRLGASTPAATVTAVALPAVAAARRLLAAAIFRLARTIAVTATATTTVTATLAATALAAPINGTTIAPPAILLVLPQTPVLTWILATAIVMLRRTGTTAAGTTAARTVPTATTAKSASVSTAPRPRPTMTWTLRSSMPTPHMQAARDRPTVSEPSTAILRWKTLFWTMVLPRPAVPPLELRRTSISGHLGLSVPMTFKCSAPCPTHLLS